MYRIGIDIGSTYTKYCVMREDREICQVYSEKTPIRQKQYFEEKYRELEKRYPNAVFVSCGYGKKNVPAFKNINELIALARGVEFVSPGTEAVLDIGGQDTKIICQENGRLREFFVNDKCAAGSGMFLANAAKMLEVEFKDIDLTDIKKPKMQLSSVCAVFAQSEIVEMIASNANETDIIEAVIWQILIKSKTLLGKIKDVPLLLSGGLTQIRGIEDFAQNALGRRCMTTEFGTYLSAIGCALAGDKAG